MDITRTIHQKMSQEHLMFVFRGEITEKNSLPLMTLLENEMKDDSYGFTGQKRLFMFVLESLQNIVKHGEHEQGGVLPVVSYSKTGDGYTITTGNVIGNDHVQALKDRIEKVNKLDVGETKNLYRRVLSTSEFSTKGGAGLGLIEMAVKTGNRLDYDFIPLDKVFSYFILSKTVDSNGIGAGSAGDMSFKGGPTFELQKLMADNNIYMIWSGHVTSGIGEEVLSLTESKLNEEDVDSRLRRRVFTVMVELLENVSKYNPGREHEVKYGMPIVMLRIEGDKFVLTTGNLINNSRVVELRNKLDDINSIDKSDLKDLFYKSLSEQTIETDSTGNMGLISMARKSGSKLDYNFKEVNDQYSYYMVTVKVDDFQE